MATLLRKLFGPSKPEYRLFMSGLDASGKTTILYRLKLGEVVTTIPTIGFNVETLENKGFFWTAWDVGGCDKIRPLHRHYYAGTNAMIFVIDSTDRDRLPEALEELRRGALELMDIIQESSDPSNKSSEYRNTPFAGIAVLANKQDRSDAMSVEYITERVLPIQRMISSTEWVVMPVCAVTGDGLVEVLDWFNASMAKVQPSAKRAWRKQQQQQPQIRFDQSPPEEELVQRIKDGRDTPEDPDEFMKQFSEGTVAPFDHRAHLRAGYLILVRARRKGMRDPKAVDEFIEALSTFFKKAGSRLRNSFNVTMTVLWCHAVHSAITSFEQQLNRIPTDTEFPDFLLHNPHLMWSGLWQKHYTKDHILNKNAADHFVLPDKQPLESYVVLQDTSKIVQTMGAGAGPISKGRIAADAVVSEGVSDEEFWKHFEGGGFDAFGHYDIVRAAYLTVKRARTSGERRGLAVKRSMELLQALLVRARAKSGETDPSILVFSETQFYFWVQMVDATIADQDVGVLHLTFRSFTSLFPEILQHDLWKRYYSAKVWESVGARVQFAVPDLKPLPTKVERRDSKVVQEAVERDRRPTVEVLKERAGKVVAELEAYDDVEFLKPLENGTLPRFTHGAFLKFIWLHIRRVKDAGERRSLGTTRILDGIDAYFANWTPVEDGDDGADDVWRAHKGLTYATFWIQMVTGALVGAKRVASLKQFGDFLDGAPELVWEPLWTLYYSAEVMESLEGRALFIPPDVRKLPSYVV
ncbi:ubiquitinyl hydrolase 1 [Rhizophlyctis rosea]|nr:ubiquitinyl hydrolase 1 [Rhizophlyctis rosea]